MKKSIFFAAILIAALGFTGCGGSDKNGGSLKITAKVENGANYNNLVDEVRAVQSVSGDDITIATAPYKNGGFKITLPEKIDERLLRPTIMPTGVTVSNTNVKTTALYGFGAYKSNIFVDALVQFNVELYPQELTLAAYLYVDADVKITGAHALETYDCDLKKGWNTVYGIQNFIARSMKYTTKKPKIDLKWYFADDLGLVSSAPSKNAKPFNF